MYYYGCKGRVGHFLFNAEGQSVSERALPNDFPVRPNILDGGLLPPRLPQDEGAATVVHVFGWTIVSFWDRSIDTRNGANSTFVLPGVFDGMEAVKEAECQFPWVFARFSFPVRVRWNA